MLTSERFPKKINSNKGVLSTAQVSASIQSATNDKLNWEGGATQEEINSMGKGIVSLHIAGVLLAIKKMKFSQII